MRQVALLVFWLAALCRVARADEPRLEVVVDPRVELLCAAMSQSDWSPSMGTFFSPYARAVQKTFFPLRAHPFVQDLERLKRRPVSIGELVAIGASRTPPPELDVSFQLPPDVVSRIGGDAAFAKIVDDLRALSRASNFPAFFEQNRPAYDQLTAAYRANLPSADAVAAFEAYYGVRKQRYTVVIAPQLGRLGYGWTVPDAQETRAFLLVSPERYADGKLVFNVTGPRSSVLLGFGRLTVNDLLRRHIDRVRQHESWFPLVRNKLNSHGVQDWPSAVKESIATAVGIRLFQKAGDGTAATRLANEAETSGLAWLPFLVERLGEYETSRTKYPTLGDFTPRLLDALDELEPVYAGAGEPGDLGLADVWLTGDGVPVKKVKPGSMAAKAGIKAGDTVTAIAGIRITGSESYLKAWHRWEASKHGEEVPFKITRNGKALTLTVTMQRNLIFQGFRRKAAAAR